MKVGTNYKLFFHKWWIWIRTFLIVWCCVPVLAGCWDEKEVEHLYYVHALGVDYHKGNYEVYVQILNPFALSKESGKSEQNTGAWIGKGVGSSYEDAIHNLYATTQRRVYWGHLDNIILSEKLLAQQGFQQTLDILTRFSETRYTTWIFCTKSPVQDVLLEKPILESSPVYSLLSDPNNVYIQSSFVEPMRLNKFLINQQEPGRPSVLPEISVAKGKWVDNKQSYSEPEMSGYGFFRKGKLIGRLSRDEMTGLRWFLPRLPRAIVKLDNDKNPLASVTLTSRKKSIQPVIVGEHLWFDVQVKVSGSIVQMRQQLSEKKLETMLAKKIEEDIRKTYKNSLRFGVDLCSLSDSLYRRNPQAFHHFATKDEGIKLNEKSLRNIKVSVKIYDSGRTTKPVTRSVP